MDGITVITPTGGRPSSFALAEHWMQRQTYTGELQWIVVDDCDPATPCTQGQLVVRPEHRWAPGKTTLNLNLLAAMPRIKYEYVLVVEDDDWYSKDYLQTMVDRFQVADIVGEVYARYYHVKEMKWLLNPNHNHACLAQTGFHLSALPVLERICLQRPLHIDIEFFRKCFESNYNVKLFSQSHIWVGIKGLPGRPGIGIGHKVNSSFRRDADGAILSSWLGEDVIEYERFQPRLRTVHISRSDEVSVHSV
jgi:hypothetical protein